MGGYIGIKMTEYIDVKSLVLFVPGIYSKEVINIPFGPQFSEKIRKHESWQNTDAWELLRNYKNPFLLVAGEQDEVIPLSLVKKCIKSSRSQNKKLITLKDIGHSVLSTLHKKDNKKLLHEILKEVSIFLQ